MEEWIGNDKKIKIIFKKALFYKILELKKGN